MGEILIYIYVCVYIYIYSILVLFLSNLKKEVEVLEAGHLRVRCQQSSLVPFQYLSIKFGYWYLKIARDCRDNSCFFCHFSVFPSSQFPISQNPPGISAYFFPLQLLRWLIVPCSVQQPSSWSMWKKAPCRARSWDLAPLWVGSSLQTSYDHQPGTQKKTKIDRMDR